MEYSSRVGLEVLVGQSLYFVVSVIPQTSTALEGETKGYLKDGHTDRTSRNRSSVVLHSCVARNIWLPLPSPPDRHLSLDVQKALLQNLVNGATDVSKLFSTEELVMQDEKCEAIHEDCE